MIYFELNPIYFLLYIEFSIYQFWKLKQIQKYQSLIFLYINFTFVRISNRNPQILKLYYLLKKFFEKNYTLQNLLINYSSHSLLNNNKDSKKDNS